MSARHFWAVIGGSGCGFETAKIVNEAPRTNPRYTGIRFRIPVPTLEGENSSGSELNGRISIMRENRRVYRRRFALMALLVASVASPAELGILTGGKRII